MGMENAKSLQFCGEQSREGATRKVGVFERYGLSRFGQFTMSVNACFDS